MALTAEQEDLRNKLAYQMMAGGGDDNTISQWAELEGMRRNPYGDQYGDGSGSTGGQGPNTGATGPESRGTPGIEQSINEQSHPGPHVDITDTKSGTPPTVYDPSEVNPQDQAVIDAENKANDIANAAQNANPWAGYEYGAPSSVLGGQSPTNPNTLEGQQPPSQTPQDLINDMFSPSTLQGQPGQPQSVLENPEAMQAYAQQEDPQQGEQQGYEGQTAAEAAAGSFGGNAAAQDAWGSAYGDAIAAGLSDDDAAAAADAAAGGYDGYGGDDEDGY